MIRNFRLLGSAIIVVASSLMAQSVKADMCEATYFSCKVGGKVVSLCGAQLGDNFNIMLNIGTEIVAEISQGEKITITDYPAGNVGLLSVHFKVKDTTYALNFGYGCVRKYFFACELYFFYFCFIQDIGSLAETLACLAF